MQNTSNISPIWTRIFSNAMEIAFATERGELSGPSLQSLVCWLGLVMFGIMRMPCQVSGSQAPWLGVTKLLSKWSNFVRLENLRTLSLAILHSLENKTIGCDGFQYSHMPCLWLCSLYYYNIASYSRYSMGHHYLLCEDTCHGQSSLATDRAL